jgi:hypothetical protein
MREPGLKSLTPALADVEAQETQARALSTLIKALFTEVLEVCRNLVELPFFPDRNWGRDLPPAWPMRCRDKVLPSSFGRCPMDNRLEHALR